MKIYSVLITNSDRLISGDKTVKRKTNPAIIGKNIKCLRNQRGVSQATTAINVSISRSLLASLEVGANYPSIPVLCSLAHYFGVSTDYILGLDD